MRLTLINPLYEINMNLNKLNNKTNKRSAQETTGTYMQMHAGLSGNHAHTCRHRMFEQHAGSYTHNLLNRARGGTLLCTRGPLRA